MFAWNPKIKDAFAKAEAASIPLYPPLKKGEECFTSLSYREARRDL
jgi:hypothetical protein